jgi:hypothetical protein
LTIDDGMAAVLERLRDKHEVSLKVLVNEAFRRGSRIWPLDKPNAIISGRVRSISVV